MSTLRVLEFYSGIGGMVSRQALCLHNIWQAILNPTLQHFAAEEAGWDYKIIKAFDINTTANEVI